MPNSRHLWEVPICTQSSPESGRKPVFVVLMEKRRTHLCNHALANELSFFCIWAFETQCHDF